MSVKYAMLKALVNASGLKREWTKYSNEELIAKMKIKNSKNIIPDLKDDDFDISKIEVMGFPVLKIIHKTKSRKANLFIIGGGMIMAPRPASVQKALMFSKETGVDVFVPYYPLCTDYPLSKAYEMIHQTYLTMLQDYEAKDISVLGSSSGGNLALGMVPYINVNHLDVPLPGYILAISPGTCVDGKQEWDRMLELDKKDILIPAQYMKNAVEIMRHGEDVPEYMIWLQEGDFTNCPKTTFIYGSDETLYACAPTFEEKMKEYNVDYEMIVGDGMFHCYPVFPLCKEAKAGWDLIVERVKEN